ncbi:hypothetical protein P5673_024192 [Acropora cervicornis]|uniref:Uncharacterized protein n=1 Tax=Acropora cervicornis TaxID=6130 RepID=A0AAD9Q4A9_ACRCE|nr:hypothetical protein P5673_024192 [Acropora cervicornis]
MKDEIQKEYIEQEKEKEWIRVKVSCCADNATSKIAKSLETYCITEEFYQATANGAGTPRHHEFKLNGILNH